MGTGGGADGEGGQPGAHHHSQRACLRARHDASPQTGCYVFICTQLDTVCVRNQGRRVCVCACEYFRVLLSGKHTGR